MTRKRKPLSSKEKRARVVYEELKKAFPGKMETPLNYTSDIELLVAVILSAQSTDKGVNKLTETLFKKYRSAMDYAEALPEELEKDLSSVNYYRTKSRNIQKAMKIIVDKHAGRVPGTLDELLSLPGVGRKTAHVVLGHLFDVFEGIAVDTHVIRLSNKFGLVRSTDPLVVERELMKALPRRLWWDFSYKLKAYGREISPARPLKDDPISARLRKLEKQRAKN